MKFFSAALPAIAGLAILAACGGSDAPAPTPQASPEEAVTEQGAAPETSTETPTETPETTAANAETPATPVAVEADDGVTPEFAALPAPYNTADYARGKRTFRLCSSCHLVEEGAGNLVGPNLHGLFGRKVGALEDFNYSDVVREADFVWTAEQLEAWLADPRGFLKGNRMSFAGVRKEDDRHAVIAYLMVESGFDPAADAQ